MSAIISFTKMYNEGWSVLYCSVYMDKGGEVTAQFIIGIF